MCKGKNSDMECAAELHCKLDGFVATTGLLE